MAMQVFDAHTHLGTWPSIKECQESLLCGMRRKNVLFSLVSHADCSSFPGEVAPDIEPLSAVEGLKGCLAFAKENEGRIFVAVWVKPRIEPFPSEELIRLMKENRRYIKAIKLHPFCERTPADSPAMEPYYALAREFDLPILVHTAVDEDSAIEHLVAAGKRNPDLRFVAAHLELGSDHRHAIEALKGVPNIYCDTAWVDLSSALLAQEELGADHVFFGTDAPVDGADTLDNPMYGEYFAHAEGSLHSRLSLVLFDNGVAFYDIPCTLK